MEELEIQSDLNVRKILGLETSKIWGSRGGKYQEYSIPGQHRAVWRKLNDVSVDCAASILTVAKYSEGGGSTSLLPDSTALHARRRYYWLQKKCKKNGKELTRRKDRAVGSIPRRRL